MKVSVIIPTLNRSAEFAAALRSILGQTRLPAEIIVVDQSGDGRTQDVLEAVQKAHSGTPVQFKYVHQKEKSSVKARNRGIAMAKGDLVSFVDDDIVLDKNYLEAALRYFESDPKVGGVMGNMRIFRAPGGFKWRLRKILLRAFLLNQFNGRMTASGFGYPIFERQIDKPVQVELFQAVAIYRKCFLDQEMFDEWFTGYCYREDAELSYRISRLTKLLMVPDVLFFHKEAASNRLSAAALKQMQIRNYHYVFEKHKHRNFLTYLIFAYSLSGIILIDFIECLTNSRDVKFEKFFASIGATVSLLAWLIRKRRLSLLKVRNAPEHSQSLP